jgi:flagellar FliL protein
MSTATATEDAAPPAPKKGKKKLLIIVGAALLVLGLAGGGTVFWLKKKAAAAAEAAADEETHAAATPKRDPHAAPVFVPLEPFTVNLADRDAERYAQVGVSLELGDAKAGDQIKVYMPVIRNNILMVLAHKTSHELLERDGKVKLSQEIQRETARALGLAVDDDPAGADAKAPAAQGDDEDAAKKAGKKKAKKPAEPNPVVAVHFSNFIIQ